MNFEFSPEQAELRNQLRRFLTDQCGSEVVHAILDGSAPFDHALWAGIAKLGILGIHIPEAYGGLGLGYLELCVVAEELGRALAPVPVSSSVYLATEFLLAAGTEAQKMRWLPRLASGDAVGTFAYAEGLGRVTPCTIRTRADDHAVTGIKVAVPDGDVANFAILAAQTADGLSLALVDLEVAGITRTPVTTIDPTRSHASLEFVNAAAEMLGQRGSGAAIIAKVLDSAAVLTAFEQTGGAERALEMARDYALERIAFGRPIGSFQAIKHMLADMYVSATLAKSNAYYAAWALSTAATELPVAAATARVSATQAYQHCARNNIQVHGGAGFTWAMDCHLHFRRANLLALNLGSLSSWEDALVERLQARRAS
jgi:alkylation response protein AidB-like acyl-CoA dehydrogenase